MKYTILIMLFFSSYTATSQELKLGDPAPKFEFGKWIKGRPVKKIENGKIYVLDFWNTSCKGCMNVFPCLTMFSKKYRKEVEFIGISVAENNSDAVAPLVKRMGNRMAYSVVVDEGSMMEQVLRPLTNHLPTTVVIGKTGLIEWVGSSLDLDIILPKIIDDKWDIRVLQRQMATESSLRKMQNNIGVIPNWDSIKVNVVEKYPDLNADSILLSWQYPFYANKGDIKNLSFTLIKYVEQFLPKLNPDLMNIYAWDIFINTSEKSDLDKAARWLESDAASIFPTALDTYANILFKLGNRKKAITAQKKALKLIDDDNYVEDLAVTFYKILNNEPTWKVNNDKYYYSNDNVAWSKVASCLRQYSLEKANKLVGLARTGYIKKAKQWNDLISVVDDLSNNKNSISGSLLNGFAWDIFKNVDSENELHKALSWSEKSFEDHQYKTMHYAYYDTKANILHKLGRSEEAIIAEKKAIELCPEKEKANYQATLTKITGGERTW